MSTSRLALRNLLRTPRRTVITTITIIAGVSVSILGRGFIDGLVEGIIAGAIDGTVGHVQARPHRYPDQPGQYPVDELLTVTPEARTVLEGQTLAWTERTYFAPLAVKGRDSVRAHGIALDLERDGKVFPHDLWRVEGALPRPGTNEIAVSTRLARLLQLSPKDTIVLQARTHPGAMNALEVTVSGIVRTGNPALDGVTLLAPNTLARELLATEAVSHISAKLNNRDDAPAFAADLQSALGKQAQVVTWQSETTELVETQQIRRKALNLLVLVLLTLAAFGIANTILMAAYERVREVGTLRSMGMTEGGVARLFVLEGALMGMLGGLLGAGLGGGLVSYWSTHPIDFAKAYETQRMNVSVSSLIYTQLNVGSLVLGVVLAVVISSIASLYPARFASRMVPADAVRAS